MLTKLVTIYYHSIEKLILYMRFKSPCRGQILKVVSYLPNIISHHFPAWTNRIFLLTAHQVEYLPLHSCSYSFVHIHLPFILVLLCLWKNFQPIEKFYKGLLEIAEYMPESKISRLGKWNLLVVDCGGQEKAKQGNLQDWMKSEMEKHMCLLHQSVQDS